MTTRKLQKRHYQLHEARGFFLVGVDVEDEAADIQRLLGPHAVCQLLLVGDARRTGCIARFVP